MEFNAKQSSENIFYRMLDDLAEGVYLIGLDWRYLYLNKTAIGQTRRTKEELLGKTMMECFPGIEHTAPYQSLQRCMREKIELTFEQSTSKENGTPAWYEMRVEPFQEGVLVLSFDITERKRAEQALRESEKRFFAVFQYSPTGIAISRLTDGKFLDVNEETCRIYGYKREEIIGRTSLELGIIQADSRQKLLEKQKIEHNLKNVELDINSRGGAIHPVLFSWVPIEINHETYMVATIVDITERKRIDEQNLRLQRLESVGSLAGGIVHDMNNILSPMMMALGRLRQNVTDAGDQKLVDMLERNSKRAAELLRQILTFARGSESKRSPLKISLVLDEVVKLLKPTFPANISFQKNFPKSLWSISADATQIHQVVVNLCVNARDAMPQGGTLSFDVENFSVTEHDTRMFPGAKPGLYVLLKVSDTGTGMSSEVKSKIFDPFFTTKEVGKGTGLGLSMVTSIVQAHEGFLDVHSELGEGTQFKIYFPAIASVDATQEQQETLEAVQGNGELILLVDDDAIVREIAMISLEASGYKVIIAADGTEAVGLYGQRSGDVRLVITDMDMPIMDGASLVRILRKMNSNLHIIGSSGTADKPRLKKLEESGINSFLAKPYTTEILLKVIYETLHQK